MWYLLLKNYENWALNLKFSFFNCVSPWPRRADKNLNKFEPASFYVLFNGLKAAGFCPLKHIKIFKNTDFQNRFLIKNGWQKKS